MLQPTQHSKVQPAVTPHVDQAFDYCLSVCSDVACALPVCRRSEIMQNKVHLWMKQGAFACWSRQSDHSNVCVQHTANSDLCSKIKGKQISSNSAS